MQPLPASLSISILVLWVRNAWCGELGARAATVAAGNTPRDLSPVVVAGLFVRRVLVLLDEAQNTLAEIDQHVLKTKGMNVAPFR